MQKSTCHSASVTERDGTAFCDVCGNATEVVEVEEGAEVVAGDQGATSPVGPNAGGDDSHIENDDDLPSKAGDVCPLTDGTEGVLVYETEEMANLICVTKEEAEARAKTETITLTQEDIEAFPELHDVAGFNAGDVVTADKVPAEAWEKLNQRAAEIKAAEAQ